MTRGRNLDEIYLFLMGFRSEINLMSPGNVIERERKGKKEKG